MYCEPAAIMDQEQAFFTAMDQAATFRIKDQALDIYDEDGERIMTFSMIDPEAITGSWQLAWYKNRTDALVTVIDGSEIAFEITEDGKITGSAGCNTFNTSFTQDGGEISLGLIATTRMACAEPEGIMEQEAVFIEALSSASTFKRTVEGLEFFDAKGTRVLVLISK